MTVAPDKKILLAAINARYTHSCLALYCLKSALRGLPVLAVIREFSINQAIDEIMAGLASEKADVIALSVYIWNSEIVKKLIPRLRVQFGNALLVLGGPDVSYNPASWMEAFPCIDYIVTGHGEEGFRFLVQNDFRCDDKIIALHNPPFAEMPLPYTIEDLAGLRNRYLYYESSRGCPFQCTYCLSSRSDQSMVWKGFETVKKELDLILGSDPKLLKFVDRTFNADRKRSRLIWQHLLERSGGGPTIFHFEIHPHLLEEEDFVLLSRCPKGLFQFEVGVQSTNQASLAAVKRTGDWSRERASLERLINLGTVRAHLDLIAGLPFDDMASIGRSFNDVYRLRPDHLQLGFLKVLPGTEMMDKAESYGMAYSEHAPYQVMENRWIGKKDMGVLERVALLVDRLFNTRRFDTILELLAGRFDSPFAMYRDMASFPGGAAAPMTRSWESGARFLMEFTATLFPREKSFFLDALRWDWCSVSRSPYYPVLIKPEGISGLKKRLITHFTGLEGCGVVDQEGVLFTISDLKRSIFFEPESDEFRLRHMKGAASAIFLPDKRMIMHTL